MVASALGLIVPSCLWWLGMKKQNWAFSTGSVSWHLSDEIQIFTRTPYLLW
jgi:hypothetical protein